MRCGLGRMCLPAAALLLAGCNHALRAQSAAPAHSPVPPAAFSWNDTTVVANAGWARMIPLRGGGWLCVDNLYPKPNGVWQVERSPDGRAWTPLGTVGEPGRNLDNGELIQMPDGTLRLTGRSVVTGQTPGARQSYHLPVYESADGGKTWGFLSQVDTSEPPPYFAGQPSQGLWEPHFFLLPDGALACAYADEMRAADTPPYSQIVSERVSPNGGRTWGPKIVVAAQIGGGSQRPGMPVVTRMKNGQYIAVYEIIGIGLGNVYFKTSRDGVTWPPGIGVRIPCQHQGPWVVSLADGRLVVDSCENRISYSDDFGATWLLANDLPEPFAPGAYSWPALYETAPGKIALMTSFHDVRIRWGTVSPIPHWPPNLTYNFTAGNDDGWTRYGGDYAFAGGAYLLQNAGTTGKALIGSTAWGDGVLEGDVMLTSAGNAGLMFRTTNAGLSNPDAAFGYYVGLDSTGSVFLSRSADDYTQLARTPMAISLNTWYHVKIVLQESKISVFVGDMTTPKMRVSDSFFLRGQVGVRAHNCNAEFNHVRYQSQ